MRTSAIIFWVLAIFFILVGIVYGLLTGSYDPMGVETVGFPAMLMLGLLATLIALTLTIFSKTRQNRPEDDEHADVQEHAGVQGSFSPYSWSPWWTAIGAALVFLSLPVGFWLAAFGAVFVIIGLVGWVMEFSRGQHAH
jgi:hypothetical protein